MWNTYTSQGEETGQDEHPFERLFWCIKELPSNYVLVTYSHLNHYQRWCMERGVDSTQAPLTEVVEFLDGDPGSSHDCRV